MSNQDSALNENGQTDETAVEAPTIETNLSEQTEVAPVEETLTEVPEAEEQTESEDKKSAQHRIRELAAEKREYKEKYESLADTVAKLTGANPVGGNIPQYTPPVKEEPLFLPGETEVDPAELERRMQAREQALLQKVQAQINFQSQRQTVFDNVNRESNEVMKIYPQLDPDSEAFDSELSESITQAVVSHVQVKPTESVRGYVDKLMKPYMRSLEKQVGSQREAISKQVSESATKPTQVPKGDKRFEDLSIEEMEARLGGVLR